MILPKRGDDTREITAAAKGEATSAWELAEEFLSRLFAAVSGAPFQARLETARSYGALLNFRDRLDSLQRQGWRFFQANCDQALEADFEDVILLARRLSVRRNEIVHSIIKGVPYHMSAVREGETHKIVARVRFFILPPAYTDRKFDERFTPEFHYSSVEMDHYGSWFSRMGLAAVSLAHRLDGLPFEPYGRKHPEPSV